MFQVAADSFILNGVSSSCIPELWVRCFASSPSLAVESCHLSRVQPESDPMTSTAVQNVKHGLDGALINHIYGNI